MRLLSRLFGLGLVACGLALAATPAHAAITMAEAVPLSSCSAPELSQPFLGFRDRHLYTLATGGDFESAEATGWQLSGGAAITQTVQADGTQGSALELPSGAQATSPVQCIASDYPTARLWVRSPTATGGVFFSISYLRNGQWTTPRTSALFRGDKTDWTLSNSMNLHPARTTGWQQVRFTLVAAGTTSSFQVDDLWIDPRARW